MMTARKRKPNLTVEADYVTFFTDECQDDGLAGVSDNVVTSYDPEVVAEFERIKKKLQAEGGRRRIHARTKSSGNAKNGAIETGLENLTSILADCVRAAELIKSKRVVGLVSKLRDAQRQVELIHAGK